MDHPAAHATEAPVVFERHFEVPVLVALLHRGEEVLAAVLDPLYRPFQLEGGRGERDLLGIHHELRAEAAADVGRDDADLVLVEHQQVHQEGAHLVSELRRIPQGQPILVEVVGRDRAAALDRMGAAAMLLHADGGAVRRLVECAGDVAVGLPDHRHHVALPPAMGERRIRLGGDAAVRHGGKRLVVHRDQGGCVLGQEPRLGDHHRHRLADEGDLVLGQHERRDVGRQLRGPELQRQALGRQLRHQIGERQHRMHAGRPGGRAGVDAPDQRMGVRAPHERDVQHVRKAEVVDEAATALQQRKVLDPLDRLADVAGAVHTAGPQCGVDPILDVFPEGG